MKIKRKFGGLEAVELSLSMNSVKMLGSCSDTNIHFDRIFRWMESAKATAPFT